MAKETNKSTTIILLVIAGALLFLVGSFTGNISYNRSEGQSCNLLYKCASGLTCVKGTWGSFCRAVETTPTSIPTATTGLTTQQKGEILWMLNTCKLVDASLVDIPNKPTSCNTICKNMGRSCIGATQINMYQYDFGKVYEDTQILCEEEFGLVGLVCNCCKF